ncbi:MAG: phosphoribosylglycinamide formyltransferase [Smithellaceae bacterium]|nr:phosphoribosylglycinamide formyltransferase [Smithellaceae bacterium]
MKTKIKIGILVSGSGSNLQSIIDNIEKGKLTASISVVVSNIEDAFALERARKHNIPSIAINHRDFSTREDFEAELAAVLKSFHVDLVVLAGFMRVLSPYFIKSFPRRIINIHPALLPSFPGVHAQRQALDYGVKFTGCSVHFVDEGVDTGPIIIQAAVPVHDDDSESSLSERILLEEHRILPEAIELYVSGSLIFTDGRLRINRSGKSDVPATHNPPLQIF